MADFFGAVSSFTSQVSICFVLRGDGRSDHSQFVAADEASGHQEHQGSGQDDEHCWQICNKMDTDQLWDQFTSFF